MGGLTITPLSAELSAHQAPQAWRPEDEALRGVAGIALKRRPAEAERLAAAVTDPLIRVKALLEHATTLLDDLDAPSLREQGGQRR